ncbi:MAG: chorismate mutase [Chloroflexota bacterium]
MCKTKIQGVRGATAAVENTPEAILSATREMLLMIMAVNPSLKTEDLASAFFTVTVDLNATYPARAARELGWMDVPLLCAREIPVPGELSRCVRVLLHWNTTIPQSDVQHVYLNEAVQLRPDIDQQKITHLQEVKL